MSNTQHAETDRLRQLQDLLRGKTLSENAGKDAMATVGQAIAKSLHERRAFAGRLAEQQEKIAAPFRELVGKDERLLSGIRAFDELVSKRKPRPFAHHPPKPAGLAHQFSMLSLGPPFMPWTSPAAPLPSGVDVFANPIDNTFRAEITVNGDGAKAGGAGLGVQFQPVADMFVQVVPDLPYDWWFNDSSSWGATSHSDGSMSIIVFSWDSNGQNRQTETQKTISLWSDGTGWFDHHSGQANAGAAWSTVDPILLSLSASRIYQFWLYTDCSCDGHQSHGVVQAILNAVNLRS